VGRGRRGARRRHDHAAGSQAYTWQVKELEGSGQRGQARDEWVILVRRTDGAHLAAPRTGIDVDPVVLLSEGIALRMGTGLMGTASVGPTVLGTDDAHSGTFVDREPAPFRRLTVTVRDQHHRVLTRPGSSGATDTCDLRPGTCDLCNVSVNRFAVRLPRRTSVLASDTRDCAVPSHAPGDATCPLTSIIAAR